MKNTTAMADYELRHIEALRKNLAGCTVLLKNPSVPSGGRTAAC